jgi:hypothetical protein
LESLKLQEQIQKLENRIAELSKKQELTDDLIEIEKLQRIYGYYLDTGKHQEIVDLFSDKTESVEIGNRGIYLRKEGARRFFLESQGKSRPAWSMARHLQLQGVVNVAPDGRTAKGRWQCLFICVASYGKPAKPTACWGYGVYENEYIKEDGNWMFTKVYFCRLFYTPFDKGWVKVPDITLLRMDPETADIPSTRHHPYPTTYFAPLHFKHPITNK